MSWLVTGVRPPRLHHGGGHCLEVALASSRMQVTLCHLCPRGAPARASSSGKRVSILHAEQDPRTKLQPCPLPMHLPTAPLNVGTVPRQEGSPDGARLFQVPTLDQALGH